MHVGWVKIHRSICDNPLWLSEPFTRGQAWADLIILANHTDGFIRARGVRIDVKRGQVGMSVVNLSKRWKWSRGKTNRFLNELEIDQQIVQQKNNVSSLISIVNYDLYQANSTTDNTANEQQTGQQTDSKRYTNKNDNNKKNEKKQYIPDWLCSETWDDFKDLRKRLKKPMTERAEKGIINKLEKFGKDIHIQVLEQSIERGWAGVFEIQEDLFKNNKSNKKSNCKLIDYASQYGELDI